MRAIGARKGRERTVATPRTVISYGNDLSNLGENIESFEQKDLYCSLSLLPLIRVAAYFLQHKTMMPDLGQALFARFFTLPKFLSAFLMRLSMNMCCW